MRRSIKLLSILKHIIGWGGLMILAMCYNSLNAILLAAFWVWWLVCCSMAVAIHSILRDK